MKLGTTNLANVSCALDDVKCGAALARRSQAYSLLALGELEVLSLTEEGSLVGGAVVGDVTLAKSGSHGVRGVEHDFFRCD